MNGCWVLGDSFCNNFVCLKFCLFFFFGCEGYRDFWNILFLLLNS